MSDPTLLLKGLVTRSKREVGGERSVNETGSEWKLPFSVLRTLQ